MYGALGGLFVTFVTTLFIPIAIVVFIIWITRSNKSIGATRSNGPSTVDRDESYRYGYWAGRQSLRDEVVQLFNDSTTPPNEADIVKLINKNQWSPQGQVESVARSADNEMIAAQSVAESAPEAIRSSEPIDYGVPLLYLGAFLFITAATLFVTLSGVGGIAKVLILAIVTVLFYVSGQLLFHKSTRLKNAGSSFVAVAILLIPLVGVAVYGYMLRQQHGLAVWLATSFICLAAYSLTWFTMKQQYLGYLMIGALVSLVESSVAQLGLSQQAFNWGLLLVASFNLVLWILASKRKDTVQLAGPFIVTANVLLPISVLYSLGLVQSEGIMQTAFTLAFAALFYGIYGLRIGKGVQRVVAWICAQLLAILSAGILVFGIMNSGDAVRVYVAFVALIYSMASLIPELKKRAPIHYEGVLVIAMISLPLALVCLSQWPGVQLVGLILAVPLQYALWRVSKSDGLTSVGVFYLYVLPVSVVYTFLRPSVDESTLAVTVAACMYATLAIGTYFISTAVKSTEPKVVFRLASPLCIITALILSLVTLQNLFVGSMLLVAISLSWLVCYRHRLPEMLLLGAVLLYLAFISVCLEFKDAQVLMQFSWFSTGLLWAVSSAFFLTRPRWSSMARTVGVVGLAMAVFAGVLPDSHWVISALSLACIGFVCIFEAFVRRSLEFGEFAGAIVMISLQWFLFQLGLREFLVFSHLWALLLLGYSLYRHSAGQLISANSYLYTSLSIVTIPFALMLLAGADVIYGWLFIAEHVTIVLLGSIVKRRGIIWWGLCSVILAVLYQLRELQFVALGLLGLFIIGIAIYISVSHTKK